jgi:hypothetical protein
VKMKITYEVSWKSFSVTTTAKDLDGIIETFLDDGAEVEEITIGARL